MTDPTTRPPIPTPRLELVAHVHVDLGPIESVGPRPDGERRFVAIVGGPIRGERLRAPIDHGRAAWPPLHPDGSITVDTRYSATTDDGAKILIATRGIRRGDPAVMRRLAAGEEVDPREYYFRVAARFEATGAYAWLTERLFVASAMRSAAAVEYDLYAVT
ncbi:MAG: DUF3237 domain-containing protein [Solirubrobacteraceae bacterium]|nr:DUF3237 domain-containing protein [Solirubrobacteraceae bacterium]